MIIEHSLLDAVVSWAKENRPSFRPNGYGRAYFSFNKDQLPSFIQDVKEKVEEHYGISKDAKQEPIYKDFIGFITHGGQVHEHSDPNHDGLIHTRFNVLVSKPKSGGEPVIGGKIVDVKEGETWRCNAGLEMHSSNKVMGDKPRIVLSFGYLL